MGHLFDLQSGLGDKRSDRIMNSFFHPNGARVMNGHWCITMESSDLEKSVQFFVGGQNAKALSIAFEDLVAIWTCDNNLFDIVADEIAFHFIEHGVKKRIITKVVGWFGATIKNDAKSRYVFLELFKQKSGFVRSRTGQGAAGEKNSVTLLWKTIVGE